MVELMLREDLYGEVFNVGSTEEVSILELAHRIQEFTGSSSEVVFVPYAEAYEAGYEDMYRRVPDITKITNATGWQPEAALNQILHEVVEHERAARERRLLVHRPRPPTGWRG